MISHSFTESRNKSETSPNLIPYKAPIEPQMIPTDFGYGYSQRGFPNHDEPQDVRIHAFHTFKYIEIISKTSEKH